MHGEVQGAVMVVQVARIKARRQFELRMENHARQLHPGHARRATQDLLRSRRPAAFPDETWPGYLAPLIRKAKDQSTHSRELAVGLFGLVPHWSKDLTIGRRTYNARSETVAEKPSFRDA